MQLSATPLNKTTTRLPALFSRKPSVSKLANPFLETPVDTVHFGHQSYPAIYNRVTLTPEQKLVAKEIQKVTAQVSPRQINKSIQVLNETNYPFLSVVKNRLPSHTPFTDYFLNLATDTDRKTMVDALVAKVSPQETYTTRRNALETLADIYFFAVRPGGRLEESLAQHVSDEYTTNRSHLRDLQQYMVQQFQTIIQNQSVLAQDRQTMSLLLSYRLEEFKVSRHFVPNILSKEAEDAIAQQLQGLINYRVSNVPPLPVIPKAKVTRLIKALQNPDGNAIRQLSASGFITSIIPQWERVAGPDNTQHSTQDYTLDEHIFRTIDACKASPHFLNLTPKEKELTLVSALFHDMAKRGGPANLRDIIPIDRIHPDKGEDVVRYVLPSLGFNKNDTETIARLVKHHQMIGNLIVSTLDQLGQPPNKKLLDWTASQLRDEAELRMLKPITEGDIRSVKKESAWFTPDVAHKLEWFSQMLLAEIA